MNQFSIDVKALKKAMIDAGFNTITALAEAANIDRSVLGRILDGSAKPSADAMFKLVDALHLDPEPAGCIFFAKNLPNA